MLSEPVQRIRMRRNSSNSMETKQSCYAPSLDQRSKTEIEPKIQPERLRNRAVKKKAN